MPTIFSNPNVLMINDESFSLKPISTALSVRKTYGTSYHEYRRKLEIEKRVNRASEKCDMSNIAVKTLPTSCKQERHCN